MSLSASDPETRFGLPTLRGGAEPTPDEVDASCRWPVMVLVIAAVLWSVGAGLLGLLASIKLHAPVFLVDSHWLTYGRVAPAAWNAMMFGAIVQGGLAVAIWLNGRLSQARLIGGNGVMVASLFWNLGLGLGIGGILAGDSTGLEGLELPRYASPILWCSYVVAASAILVTFHARRRTEVYISHWYLLAALFAFSWLFAAAHIMVVFRPLRGVLLAAVQGWFMQGFLNLWVGFMGLAAVFYLLPKAAGRPVPSRSLALFGFWVQAVAGGVGGAARYHGGPFPAWMASLGTVASVLSLFAVIAVALNMSGFLRPPVSRALRWRELGFARLALISYLVWGVMSATGGFSTVRRVVQFTLFPIAADQLLAMGLGWMGILGVVYHTVPRVMKQPWASVGFIRAHFVLAGGSVLVLVAAYGIGGWVQGLALNHADIPFIVVVKRSVPFLASGTLASLFSWLGSLVLLVNLGRLLLGAWRGWGLPEVRAWVEPWDSEAKP